MIFFWLLLLVPISLVLEYVVHAPPAWVFMTSMLAVVPLAEWIRRATEHLAHRTGPGIGGLLNVTFGNMAELIIAVFVLMAGNGAVVKAQLTGAIMGNGLLGLGLAILVGSWGREKQVFQRENVSRLTSLLMLSFIALLLPAMFDYTERGVYGDANPGALNEKLSLGVSVVLILVYVANLIYTLVTHKSVYSSCEDESVVAETGGDHHAEAVWPLAKSLAVLIGATIVTAVEAEMLSGALEATAQGWGLRPYFLGIVLLAVIGNAAEYVSAVYFARKGQIGLVLSITVGSSIQLALMVAPLLVIISALLHHPMNLVFSSPLELVAIAAVAFSVNSISQDGETNWFEGALLLGVYALFVLAFYYVKA